MSDANELINLTADIVSAHVSNNSVETGELPDLIAAIYAALSQVGQPSPPEVLKLEPAVTVRSSVKSDYIVCLEDGKKLKMLKRYLRTNYNMSPEEYRTKWGLPRDYPMVAPAYAETRKALAKKIGLGRKRPAVAEQPVSPAPEAKAKTLAKAPTKARGIKAAKEAAQAHLGATEA